jgi:hypothetical protein
MDFAFTGHSQIPKHDEPEWLQEFQDASFIEQDEQQRYKAIVDIDGYTWSSRFASQLCRNSVLVKVKPKWVDYFDKELKPWVHYVPVHANLSNLAETVDYVLSNDDEMQQIVQNANKWCASRLVRERLQLDMMWMLVAYYESLDRHDPMWRQVWRANVTAYTLPNLDMVKVTRREYDIEYRKYVRRRRWRNTWKRFGFYRTNV